MPQTCREPHIAQQSLTGEQVWVWVWVWVGVCVCVEFLFLRKTLLHSSGFPECRGMEEAYEAPSNEAPRMTSGYSQGRL